MSLDLEFLNKTRYAFSRKVATQILQKTLLAAGVSSEEKPAQLSMTLVGEREMEKLNKLWMGKEAPTDVLSFAQAADRPEFVALCAREREVFLGEIVLCPSYIERSAPLQGKSWRWEMAYITSHGLLHLLGYGHGPEMFAIQQQVADSLGLE